MLGSAILSFIKRDHIRLQFVALVFMALSVGLLTALLSTFGNKMMMVWPLLMLFRILTLSRQVISMLPKQ
jgi:hypothetical protein